MKQPVGRRRRIRWLAYVRAWRSWSVLEGLVGTILITAGSLTPAYLPLNSPWWSRLNEAGLRGSTWRIVGTLLVLVGVGLLVDSWLRLRPGREPRDLTAEPLPKHARRCFKHLPGIRAGLHPWAVLGVWGLPFLLAPPIFSHDAYSYAAQGWLLENGISPYAGYPGLLPGAFADQVAQEWRYTKTPYGPLALVVQHGIVHLTGDNPYWSSVFMRVPALLGVIAIGLLLSRVARRVGRDPHFAAWFSTLNPILVVDFIGGAHNDALMMGLVVIGLWIACMTSWSWAIGAVLVGGNHLIHAMRRNVNLTILMFNNRIYGLTKGQYSPTSEAGKVTKSSPMGSIDAPFNPLAVALGAGCSFVARAVDSDRKHLAQVLTAAAKHRGTSFVEMYQNCPIFNDGAFDDYKGPEATQHLIRLVDGEPVLVGADNSRGVVRDPVSGELTVADVAEVGMDHVLVHDSHRADPSLAFELAHLDDGTVVTQTPVGIFYDVDRPTYDDQARAQVKLASGDATDPGSRNAALQQLLLGSDTWQVQS